MVTTRLRPADDQLAPVDLCEHVPAGGGGQLFHCEIAIPLELQDPVAAAAHQLHVTHLLRMLGVQRIDQTENRSELVDDQPIGAVEGDERHVRVLGQAAAMVAGDVRDDRRLLVREPEDLGRREDVLRMLMVGAQAHVNAQVMKERRHLQQQTLAIAEPVLRPELFEQPGGEPRDVLTVVAIEPVAMAERLGARQHLVLEVFRGHAFLWLGDVEDDARAERRGDRQRPPAAW